MSLFDIIYEFFFVQYYYLTIGLFWIILLFYLITKNFDKVMQFTLVPPEIVNKVEIGTTNKYKKIDTKCYGILYNVYNMIGSTINVEKSEFFDEQYLLKLTEAKKIFYGVKRNKDLLKSNYLLIKILKKMRSYEIAKNEIDDTIIYLIVLVLNKKKKRTS